MGDVQSRKWLLTINNPADKGYTHEYIKEQLAKIKACVYWCMSDEVGLMGGTFHTHIYIACKTVVRFSSLQKKFEGAHFDVARGTSDQNRDYVYKTGKWSNTEKEDTNIPESHEEWGEIPVERQGKRNDIDDLVDMIKQGMTDYEILESNPQYMMCMDKVERCRQTYLEEKYKDTWRDLHVTYIYGETGSGKTRSVMEKYGYSKVFRVTDYEHPFDGYKGQDIICFEEFRSNIRIDDMLKYLDGYPVELRCRYANKHACFTKVYIISNIPLHDQYRGIQREEYESWLAFLRRIHEVQVFKGGKVHVGTTHDYMYGFVPCEEKETPFTDKEEEKEGEYYETIR